MEFKKIRVYTKTKMWEGVQIPSDNNLILKLDNGYNIGIKKENIIRIEEIGKITITPRESKQSNEGSIIILGCGGTIASRVDYTTGAVTPAYSPEEIIQFMPDDTNVGDIEVKMLFQRFSEDMGPKNWLEIAKELQKYKKPTIIMHGTDTMHYTASALSFLVSNKIPIIMVGAQRSSDRPSSDAYMNLKSAITLAKEDFSGVVVVMHETINDTYAAAHLGVRVRKMHTSKRDTFRTISGDPAARINMVEGNVKWNEKPKTIEETNGKLNTNVALIKVHPGIKPEFIEYLSKYDGVVLEGTGFGHAPINKRDTSVLESLKYIIKEGTQVYMTSQTIHGKTNSKVYSTGRILERIGVNYVKMIPETAYVKLMWALTYDDTLQRMKTNYMGEILERETYGKDRI